MMRVATLFIYLQINAIFGITVRQSRTPKLMLHFYWGAQTVYPLSGLISVSPGDIQIEQKLN